MGLFASLFARLWYLQVLQNRHYTRAAVHLAYRTVDVAAPRGRILDRTGRVLADDRPSLVVSINRPELAKVTDQQAVLSRLGGLLNRYDVGQPQLTLQSIEAKLNDQRYGPYQNVPIATDVSPATQIYLTEHPDEFPAIAATRELLRQYPYGALAGNVLGYVGPITQAEYEAHRSDEVPYTNDSVIGRVGVEASMETWLRGVPGKITYEVDPAGRVIRTVKVVEPIPGDDVYLTIDATQQARAEQALQQEAGTARAGASHPPIPAGSAVSVDPSNGQVELMASFPSYDPNQFIPAISQSEYSQLQNDPYSPLINRAVAGLYPDGSTFKLFTTYAALSTGLITPDFTVDDGGTFTIPGCSGAFCTRRNAEGAANGSVNLQQAITVSSDVYFYTIGYMFWQARGGLGDQPIQNAAHLFGLGHRTGIELPEEQEGFIPTPADRVAKHKRNPTAFPDPTWRAGDNLNIAVGQGEVQVTPLQLANAYATFANGGTRYRPTLLLKVTKAFNPKAVVDQPKPQVLGHVPFGNWYGAMLNGFEGATSGAGGTATGTFAGFPMSQFQVAGKTGTAQIPPDPKTGAQRADDAWFVGFGPVPNERWAMATVMQQGGFGATAAAPVVRDVLTSAATGLFPPVQWVTRPAQPGG